LSTEPAQGSGTVPGDVLFGDPLEVKGRSTVVLPKRWQYAAAFGLAYY